MTPAAFRKLALSLPDAIESSHMGHPDFRLGKKIFATLGPDESWGMVKLTPEQQAEFVATQPQMFEPFNGAWGRRGCTKVHLKAATKGALAPAMIAAWQIIASSQISKKSPRSRKHGNRQS